MPNLRVGKAGVFEGVQVQEVTLMKIPVKTAGPH